jgi:hypothetical protein
VPQSSIGAPMPIVMSDESQVVVAYYMENRDPDWDGTSVRILDAVTSDEPIALVRFNHSLVHMFGSPNDEAFSGHPLASRGLHPYGAFQIEKSSWIRQLEKMNSVHPNHNPEFFWRQRHLVLAFHDSTFECVCRDFDVRTRQGSLAAIISEMADLLRS